MPCSGKVVIAVPVGWGHTRGLWFLTVVEEAVSGRRFETRSVAARGSRAHVMIVGQEATLCGLVPTGDLLEDDTEQCAECAMDWRSHSEEPRMVQRTRVIVIQPEPVVAKRGRRP